MFSYVCLLFPLLTACTASTVANHARELSQALGLGADIAPLCPEPCLECQFTEIECRYGFHKNVCGEVVCAKGPAETCGGMFDSHGHCGHGLTCRCNVCTGCSTDTLDCYYKHCDEHTYSHDERFVRGISPSFLF